MKQRLAALNAEIDAHLKPPQATQQQQPQEQEPPQEPPQPPKPGEPEAEL